MAAPTQPTETTICTEALKRFLNGGTPGSSDITRAIDYGFQHVKRQLMGISQTWNPLKKIDYKTVTENISKYANPDDCEKLLSVTLLHGDHTGTLSAVASTSSMTLAADEDISQDEAEGAYLAITAGTGINQCVQISGYDSSTKVVTLAEAFTTLPVIGDSYMVCDDFKDLIEMPSFLRDREQYSSKDKPTYYYPNYDSTYGFIQLMSVPDDTYMIKREYFADLRRLDTTVDLYTTILRRWAGIFEQGVYAWKLGEDDDRYERETGIYTAMLRDLRSKDAYMADISDLRRSVVE